MNDSTPQKQDEATSAASELNAVLAACPCGNIPPSLCIVGEQGSAKWAHVYGMCCGEWLIEFRTNYHALDSAECMALATEAWNEAPRAANNDG